MTRAAALQVVVLNGGSSSGKSSLARVLQETLDGVWLLAAGGRSARTC